MSRVLDGLKPERVFYYFEEICNIPHVSYHTELLSDYCEEFAKSHGFRYKRDEFGNVIIYKNASAGYENVPAVIIQGHLDMVGAKEENSTHDFLTDPIQIMIEDGWVTAKGTTLGADNGIAVAMALAILEDNSLKHPALEIVLTTDEEVGLCGAEGIDPSALSAKYMLNLDSEDEGIFLTGSAGGLGVEIGLLVNMVEYEGTAIKLIINNLKGGHSGAEIGTGRPSANVLMGRLLKALDDDTDYYLRKMSGGVVDNAICPKCVASIVATEDEIDTIKSICNRVMTELRQEYMGIDEGITITAEVGDNGVYEVCDDLGKDKILCLLVNLPYGVMARSGFNVNFVETSLNLGILEFKCGALKMVYSVRSSIQSAKRNLADRLWFLADYVGATYEESGDYPAWTYNPNSTLRKIIGDTYKEYSGKDAEFTTIHAGLECGIFADKLPGIDIVSFGPDMKDIHTFDEKMKIDSVERVYEFTLKLLENIKE